jgi:hypothetical protein
MTPDYNKSGIYKLICKTCNKAYIGQTSQNLSLRFHKHIRYIKKMIPNRLTPNISYKTSKNMAPSQTLCHY